MNVTDLADEIYRELDYPEDLGIPNIVFFLTSNIGQLNVLIGSSYSLTQNNQIDPELGIAEAVILKYIYFVHYYNRLVRSNLGASAYDFSEISEGDTTIRRASRNEISKTYSQAKNALQERLNKLLLSYKQDQTVPQSLSAAHDLLRFYRI